jgi:hypothetical protein
MERSMNLARPKTTVRKIIAAAMILAFALPGCGTDSKGYRTFADYPGFKEYYAGHCSAGEPIALTADADKELLRKHRPRLILPPGGQYPIDFYRDYLPNSLLRRYPGDAVVTEEVTPELLKANQHDRSVYLDLQLDRVRAAGLQRRVRSATEEGVNEGRRPAVYGRVYRETVTFADGSGGQVSRNFTFLKYNVVFATSGLPARLPTGFETFLKLAGFDVNDWHQLDNFVATHVVLDEDDRPVAVILAQHNDHRTYLVGKDVALPADGRMVFDIALRSNEVYLDSQDSSPVEHRVVRWTLYLKYLLSGEDAPFFRGYDLTYGVNAGGREVSYNLAFLSPCDPFYTATIMLGEPRPFLWWYIGRDGPPGADYYEIPPLLPLGNLLKFSYLHDGDPEDISMVERSTDVKKKKIDVPRIMEYGGTRFYRDLIAIHGSAR